MRLSLRLALGVAMSALGVTGPALADDAIFHTVTYVEVIPPAAARGLAALRHYGEASRQDAGNLRVELLRRVDRPSHFAILAAWRNEQAFEAHRAARAAAEFRDALQPLLASPNDERPHRGLSVGPAPPARPAPAIYVVTHVDVIPPRKDDGVAALERLAERGRRGDGNERFDVLQQINRPNHFTVVETWMDRDAFDAHGMAAHTRRFREQLAPMSGALYDERLYQALD
jgi:quinol monooxygenase YgiN